MYESVDNSYSTGDSLKTLDQAQFGKWSHYLNLKAAVYQAYVRESLHLSELSTTFMML